MKETKHKFFENACIYTQYSGTWFVSFNPWFDGDNMVCSFVKKNTSGDESFKIYMSLFKFEQLIKDIENGKLYTKLQNSNDKNPAFKYVTGDNGGKQITIFLSDNKIIIHGYYKNANYNQNANVPITRAELEILAQSYHIVAEPDGNVWHKMLYDTFWLAYEKNKKYFNDGNEKESAKEESQEKKQEKQNTPKPVAASTAKPSGDKNIQIKLCDKIKKTSKGNIYGKGYFTSDPSKKEFDLEFSVSALESLEGRVDSLISSSEISSLTLTVDGYHKGNHYCIDRVA